MTFEQHQNAIREAAHALNKVMEAAAFDGIATTFEPETWNPGPTRTKCAFIRHVHMLTTAEPPLFNGVHASIKPEAPDAL